MKKIMAGVMIGAISALCILMMCGFGFNKQIVDFNYHFTKVYLLCEDSTKEYKIKSWNDWDDSDMVQFTTIDGKVFYTHASRVIFVGE